MDTTPDSAPASGWRTMAMIEVDGAAGELEAVLADVRHDCRLHSAASVPGEKTRFYLVADASRGQAHAVRSVGLMLLALDAIARSGELQGYRVIAAEERLLEAAKPHFQTLGAPGARADLRSAALA